MLPASDSSAKACGLVPMPAPTTPMPKRFCSLMPASSSIQDGLVAQHRVRAKAGIHLSRGRVPHHGNGRLRRLAPGAGAQEGFEIGGAERAGKGVALQDIAAEIA